MSKKHVSEQKQDLLLDALSCIDEDILARGLALRDGGVTSAADTVSPTPKATEQAPSIPPLYDLGSTPSKPPKKNLWRVISVVAAACLLVCVVPLSMWMAARFGLDFDLEAADGIEGTLGSCAGIEGDAMPENKNPQEPSNSPGDRTDGIYDSPVEGDTPMKEPEYAVTEGWGTEENDETAIPSLPYSPQEWDWGVVSAQNGAVEKNTVLELPGLSGNAMHYAYTATVDTFGGSGEEPEDFRAQTVSPEDEMVLDMYAQYCLSLYGVDYGSHFLLFHPDIVKLRFTNEVQPYSYTEALGRINTLIAYMRPYDTLSVDATLLENRLLAGSELAEYLDSKRNDLAEAGLDTGRITAVREFVIEGSVTVEGRFPAEEWGYGSGFYCYEYDGVWYLDDDWMDDDLCIDFALSDLIHGHDYLDVETYRGTVAAIEDGYIYMEDGYVFATEAIARLVAKIGVTVGDQVVIEHYDFGLPVRVQPTDSDFSPLYGAISITVYED